MNLSARQPYGDAFIRQRRRDLKVLQVFDGSQGVKLPFPGASSCLKTRVLESSCPRLPYSFPADGKLCCGDSCCQAEWAWIWPNSYLDVHFLLFTPHCSAFAGTHPNTVWREIRKQGVEVKGDKVFCLLTVLGQRGAQPCAPQRT